MQIVLYNSNTLGVARILYSELIMNESQKLWDILETNLDNFRRVYSDSAAECFTNRRELARKLCDLLGIKDEDAVKAAVKAGADKDHAPGTLKAAIKVLQQKTQQVLHWKDAPEPYSFCLVEGESVIVTDGNKKSYIYESPTVEYKFFAKLMKEKEALVRTHPLAKHAPINIGEPKTIDNFVYEASMQELK